MKRYVILTVGYQHVALPYSNGAELSSLVAAISEGKQVNSVGYGDEQKYVPASDEPVQFMLVDAARVPIGDEVTSLKAQLKAAQEQAESNQKNWLSYYQKNQELEKKLKEMQTPPPPQSEAPRSDDDFPI